MPTEIEEDMGDGGQREKIEGCCEIEIGRNLQLGRPIFEQGRNSGAKGAWKGPDYLYGVSD